MRERVETRLEITDGGWWPPGHGEPGESWDFEETRIALNFDGAEIDVLQVTPDGDRALASIPLAGVARLLAEHFGGDDG
jgi:hypothetical protein